MRGPSKSLPKYRKHRASGQAVVTFDGTDFYLGPRGTKASKLEYDRLIGEWLANGRRLSSANATISVTELIVAPRPPANISFPSCRRQNLLFSQ